jgi:YVTN family beta-propeller protein
VSLSPHRTRSFPHRATNRVTGSIVTGVGARNICYVAALNRAFVTNFLANTVSVINTLTNTVVGNPIPVGMNPHGITYDPKNNSLYVTDRGSNQVSVIRLASA